MHRRQWARDSSESEFVRDPPRANSSRRLSREEGGDELQRQCFGLRRSGTQRSDKGAGGQYKAEAEKTSPFELKQLNAPNWTPEQTDAQYISQSARTQQ